MNNWHQDRRDDLKARGMCIECGKMPATSRCDECGKRSSRRQMKHMEKIKQEVFDHYGKKCACCGEHHSAMLTIDHMNNDGAEHRREVGSSKKFYIWLRKNGFPEGFQTLCFNCNTGRYINGGVCPHKEEI